MVIKFIAAILLLVIGGLIVYIIDGADRKEVKRLEQALDLVKKDYELDKEQHERVMKKAFEDISKMAEIDITTPRDCKKGPWCAGCTFVKEYRARDGYGSYVTKHYCGKEEACKNFVENKEI